MPVGNTRVAILGEAKAEAAFSLLLRTREEAQLIADRFVEQLEREGAEVDSLLRQLAREAE